LRRAEPGIDIRTATDAGLEGLQDPEVLQIAANSGRVLVSQDRRTMPLHFSRYVARAQSPGVIPNASDAAEWIDRLVWIPL